MDMSKLSDSDLQALASKDMSKMSDEGLKYVTSQSPQTQQAQQKAGPQPFSPAENIDQAQPNGLMDYLKKGMGMAASHMAGVVKAGTLGNVDPSKFLPGMKQTVDQNPISNKTGDIEGSIGAGTVGGTLMPAISRGGALGRVLSGAAQGGVLGGLSKPQGDDSMQSRLAGAGTGALGGAAVSGALEGANALPAAIKSGFRSVLPENAETYYNKLEQLVKGKTGSLNGQTMSGSDIIRASQDASNSVDKARALSALNQMSPEAGDVIGQKASEMFGKNIRDRAFSPAATISAMTFNPKPMLAPIAAGAVAGGGAEAIRQMGKNGTSIVNQPETLQSILDLLHASKDEGSK